MEFNFDAMAATPTDLLKDNTFKEPAENILDSVTSHTQPPQSILIDTQAHNATGQSLNLASLISADLQIKLLNSIMPVVLVLIIDRAAGKKIDKNYFELDRDEESTLKPVLDAYLKSINFNIESPFNALVIALACIYGTKVIEGVNSMPVKKAAAVKPEMVYETATGKKRNRPFGLKYNKKRERIKNTNSNPLT